MLISKESIFLNENLTSQEEVFRFIAQKSCNTRRFSRRKRRVQRTCRT